LFVVFVVCFVGAGTEVACLMSVAPTGLARTTGHSQILCQGQKWVKAIVFNDKISDLWQIWVKFNDKISEMG